MVRDAAIVLLHGSVALNFAVLYRKPVIFITLDMFKETRLESLTNEMADRLGKSPINISEPHTMEFEAEFRFDRSKYQRVIRNPSLREKRRLENLPFTYWRII